VCLTRCVQEGSFFLSCFPIRYLPFFTLFRLVVCFSEFRPYCQVLNLQEAWSSFFSPRVFQFPLACVQPFFFIPSLAPISLRPAAVRPTLARRNLILPVAALSDLIGDSRRFRNPAAFCPRRFTGCGSVQARLSMYHFLVQDSSM